MIFSNKCIKIALLLYFIHDVVSHPKTGVEDGAEKRGSLRRANIKNLKNTVKHKREGDGHMEGQIELNNQSNGGVISGHIKLNDEGGIEKQENVPNYDIGDKEQNDPLESNQQEEGEIKGNIEYDDASNIDIKGSLELPSETESKDNDGPVDRVLKPDIDLTESDSSKDKSDNEDFISGQILEDYGNIEGEINLHDNDDFSYDHTGIYQDNYYNNKDGVLSGSIEINDNRSIDGTINVPDLDDNQQDTGNTNRGESGDGGTFIGSIEFDKDIVEGAINIPNNMDVNASNVTRNPNAFNGDISGEVVIDDEGNIEGHLDFGNGNGSSADEKGNDHNDTPTQPNPISDFEPKTRATTSKVDENSCWLRLNGNQYLDALNQLDAKYSKAREQYEEDMGADFDNQMMQVLLSSQGKAPRAIHQAHGNPNVIPAGLNLGGLGMLRMPNSMLFFHRLKLRNSTIFNVNFLHTSFIDMTLVARLSLNDLHLSGVYERAITEDNDGTMFFRPSHGELEVLMNSTEYKMEGRLRMLNNRLMIEIINSELVPNQLLLAYANSTNTAEEFSMQSVEGFIGRVKCDLDIWLKDYFNDYLMYFGIVGSGKNSEFQLYEKQKIIKTNEYADHVLKSIKRKLRDMKAANVILPAFKLLTIKNQRLQMKNGVLLGLDSMYRRSVAMTKKNKSIRTFDITIGFSNLKVQYNYEGFIMRGTPPLAGQLILTADELTAHLVVTQVDGMNTVDIDIDSILQFKPETLTVEGPANRLIADFKYILENPIVALMTNVMKHNVKMLKTITRCEPLLWGFNEKQNPTTESADELYRPKNTRPYINSKDDDLQVDSFSKETDEETPIKHTDKGSDYVFSKNDSVEIEVPVNGKVQKMKLKRNENFVLSKLSKKIK